MRVTEKGQVTIPKAVRETLGIGPGSEVDFVDNGGSVVLVRIDHAARRRRDVKDWLRSVRGTGTGEMTTEEVMDATRGPFDDLDPR